MSRNRTEWTRKATCVMSLHTGVGEGQIARRAVFGDLLLGRAAGRGGGRVCKRTLVGTTLLIGNCFTYYVGNCFI